MSASTYRLPILSLMLSLVCVLMVSGQVIAKVPAEMRLIPAGEFQMGSTGQDAWAEEKPAHKVRVSAYYLDETEVTNAQFSRFVKATGYRTVAERPIDVAQIMKQVPAGTPTPSKESLKPGSLVFEIPSGPVDLRDYTQWWKWTPGASWRAPAGPGSTIKGREHHPVVHLAWDDAVAYCRWAGKRLPTEAEWERAARGGVDGMTYVWGDSKPNDQSILANIWQGIFPHKNTKVDGFTFTAPVKSFKPNQYGLYDMAGNVWEWTADWFDPNLYRTRVTDVAVDPKGPLRALDPQNRRTQRGGSFLCHDSYCTRYRPAARQGATADSGTSHAGVRCAASAS